MLKITSEAAQTYPTARFGVMAINNLGVTNRPVMDDIVARELAQIRAAASAYERKTALEAEPLCHYAVYYKKFKKSYPVLGQLESVTLKGKGLPPIGAPVEAMFLAEVKNLLLTAGHDADLIEVNMSP